MNKLYRSKKDRWIAGVCGGLAESTGINSLIIRLFFLFTSGLGGIYLLLWLFIPENPTQKGTSELASLGKFLLLLLSIPVVFFLAMIVYVLINTFTS